MKKTTLLILLLIPMFCLSQTTITIQGNVQDAGTPLAWGNVVLSSLEGKYVIGSTTKTDGNFQLKTQTGLYKLTITAIGFMIWEKDIALYADTILGQIILMRNATALNEVIVKSNSKMIEQKIDRMVYHVEKNIALVGGDALNAIRTAPGVIVQNNSISILGKGVTRVMVDGRMVELSGEELNNFLKSIAANDIKNIEVISNPSAKYDANGSGGLININLKKGTRNAWRNSSSLSYDQNTYSAIALRNHFFYNKNKFRFSVSANTKLGNSLGKETLDIFYPTGLWQLGTNSKIKENNVAARLGLDYDVSKKTNIGFQYMGEKSNSGFSYVNDISINNPNSLQSKLINDGNNNQPTSSHGYNVHLVSKLDSLDRKISVDLDYFRFMTTVDNDFVAKKFLPDMSFINIEQAARNISSQAIQNMSIKVDIEHPLQFANLTYGVKLSFTNSNSDVQYYNTITGLPVADLQLFNTFQYKENNQALFINADKTFKKQLSLQVGLRAEYTQTKGYTNTAYQQTNNDYLKIFPSIFVSYQVNDSNLFNISYGKRINRPSFALLNPFRAYINSNSYSEGNPFLQPSYANNIELSHTYKEKWRTNVFLNFTTDGFGVIFTSNPATNTQRVSRENYYREYYYGIGETDTATITKQWQSQTMLYLLGAKTNFTNSIQSKPSNSPQIYFATNHSFTLGNTSKLAVDFFYSSAYKRGLYKIGYMAGLNLALRQDLLQNKIQFTLLVNDVFNTAYLKEYTSIVNGINQSYSENNSSRFIRASFSYSFGKKKIKVQPRDFGNEDEKGRALGK